MKIEGFKNFFEEIRGEKRFDEPMRNHTSFRIGGKADLLIFPEDIDDLKKVLYFCSSNKIPLTVVGRGTNLLVSDKGIRGIVVNLRRGFKEVTLAEDENVVAGAGAGLQSMVNFALKKKLSGIEFAAGIPGSVGGALIMNAGAEKGEMGDVIQEVRIITAYGEIRVLKREDIKFSYRHSEFPSGSIVFQTRALLKRRGDSEIRRKMELLIRDRRLKQPLYSHCAGSVFKNPDGDFAGRLIELAGLKGFSVGDAVVSEMHANFIINRGRAAADDVLKLIEIIKERVFTKTGVSLEEEIKIVGEDCEIKEKENWYPDGGYIS